MDSIGYYIMLALLCVGAAYGLANKGKPRPKVSWGQKKILIICAGILTACVVLGIAVAMLPHSPAPH